MKTEANDKQELILEAAIRRFSHFGVGKTTMTEIADDVALTKQSLAYYFADKQSLVIAVVELIINQYLQEVEQNCLTAASVEEALLQLTEIKKSFFERYYMLYLQNRNHDLKIGANELLNVKEKINASETNLLIRLLQRGMEKGEIRPIDVQKTSMLVLQTLTAFEVCLKSEKAFPDHQDFIEMNEKQKAVLHLFINGLKVAGANA